MFTFDEKLVFLRELIMAQSTLMRFAPVFLGVAAASTLLAPLSAQAANASYGTGYVKFLDIKLTLDGADLFNVPGRPASKGNTASGALVPGPVYPLPNPDNGGPDVTPGPGQPLPTTGSVSSGGAFSPSFSNANATIDIPARVAGMTLASSNADSTFSLTRPISESTSNSANNQTNLIFTATAGQTVALSGLIDAYLGSEVVGTGVSQVQFNTSFTITKNGLPIGTNCNAIPAPMGCFVGPVFQGGVAVIGSTGVDDFTTGGPQALPPISYVIPMNGNYTVVFNSNITSQGTHAAMSVPEPSAVLGLAGVALVGVLARKRRLG